MDLWKREDSCLVESESMGFLLLVDMLIDYDFRVLANDSYNINLG